MGQMESFFFQNLTVPYAFGDVNKQGVGEDSFWLANWISTSE